MSSCVWFATLGVILSIFAQAHSLNLFPRDFPKENYPTRETTPHRLRRVAPDPRSMFRRFQTPPMFNRPSDMPTTPEYQDPIKRGGPPYFYIQPMTMGKRQRSGRRLVLTLPKDNIQILNAEAMPERGQTFLPTTLTLSLRDSDSDDSSKGPSRYSTTRSYASQIPSPPRQASRAGSYAIHSQQMIGKNAAHVTGRFHYGFVPVPHSGSEEEDRGDRKLGRWNKGEVSYEMDDLVGSSGGHVTVIKAQTGGQSKVLHARKVMSSGGSYKPLKAIIIEPKEIEAKRIRVIETDAESVSATKARVIKPQQPMISTAMKAKVRPVSFKKGILSKSKGEDWAASNIHFAKAEPPMQEAETRLRGEEDMPPMELNCGGTNDLGWCDLGANYPSAEVSQIMDVCEELVSRMFVEVPEDTGVMEDVASYSLSRNITHHRDGDSFWPWKSHSTHFQKSLCDLERDVIRPSFAQDIKGKWHVIIQTEAFPQKIALEVCKKPGEPCSSSNICSTSKSQCVQKYSHHQLISFDPESAETCPYVRLYKFPTSCVCRLEQ